MITLKTLPEATEQEVFDQAVTHLLTQNAKSTNDNGNCRYRGENGLKCVAGCFIADDEYKSVMEVRSWRQLHEIAHLVPREHARLIQTLQYIHDDHPVSHWKEELEALAEIKNLKFNPPVAQSDEQPPATA